MTKVKDQSGKEILDEIKAKRKEQKKTEKEIKMNNLKAKLKTPAIVLATLAVVAALYVFHVWSFDKGVESQKAIAAEVEAQVSQLKLVQK